MENINNSMQTKEEKKLNIKELMILEAVKKLDNPFINITVQDVAKDLKMGENSANQVFKRADFPSVNLGKPKAFFLKKKEKNI